MFDIGWSELLILGVVTLIFVGPKELPVFLRTIGRYMGMVRRQAAEFRAHFDEAMREAELDALKKDVESMTRDVEGTMRDAGRSIQSELDVAKAEIGKAAEGLEQQPQDVPEAIPPPDVAAGSQASAPQAETEPDSKPAVAQPARLESAENI